jgi:hypothetical protein
VQREEVSLSTVAVVLGSRQWRDAIVLASQVVDRLPPDSDGVHPRDRVLAHRYPGGILPRPATEGPTRNSDEDGYTSPPEGAFLAQLGHLKALALGGTVDTVRDALVTRWAGADLTSAALAISALSASSNAIEGVRRSHDLKVIGLALADRHGDDLAEFEVSASGLAGSLAAALAATGKGHKYLAPGYTDEMAFALDAVMATVVRGGRAAEDLTDSPVLRVAPPDQWHLAFRQFADEACTAMSEAVGRTYRALGLPPPADLLLDPESPMAQIRARVRTRCAVQVLALVGALVNGCACVDYIVRDDGRVKRSDRCTAVDHDLRIWTPGASKSTFTNKSKDGRFSVTLAGWLKNWLLGPPGQNGMAGAAAFRAYFPHVDPRIRWGNALDEHYASCPSGSRVGFNEPPDPNDPDAVRAVAARPPCPCCSATVADAVYRGSHPRIVVVGSPAPGYRAIAEAVFKCNTSHRYSYDPSACPGGCGADGKHHAAGTPWVRLPLDAAWEDLERTRRTGPLTSLTFSSFGLSSDALAALRELVAIAHDARPNGAAPVVTPDTPSDEVIAMVGEPDRRIIVPWTAWVMDTYSESAESVLHEIEGFLR